MNNLPNSPRKITSQILEKISKSGNNQNTGKSNFEDVLRGKLMQQPCSSHTFPEETLTSFRIPKTIEFGNISFHLDQSSPKYSRLNYRSFNEDLLKSKSHWHLVVIQKEQRFGKKDLLEALYSAVQNDLFAPFAYHEGSGIDFFIIFNQIKALTKLFDIGLEINVSGIEVPLNVYLGVAKVLNNHPTIIEKIVQSIKERMISSSFHGDNQCLDLSHYADILGLNKLTISLSNMACLNLLCDQINSIERIKTHSAILKFANNDIQTLEPFTKFYGFKIAQLDLRANRIAKLEEFHYLKHLDIQELLLAGNACTKLKFYKERIQEIIPTVQKIDGQQFNAASNLDVKKIQKAFKIGNGSGNDPINTIDETSVLIRGGIRLRPELAHLRDSFQSYRNDSMWTQVIIQHGKLYSKEDLLEEIVPRLFNSNPFFPCYYKRFGDRDEFYLYKNFDSLRNLMLNNLQIDMPPHLEKVFFSLRLNASLFKDGQVDWFHKIVLVLSKRIKNNILDLNNFSNDPEFSNLTVPMNSKYTLNFLLETAKRQNNHITRINAQGNGITTLEGCNLLTSFTKLVTLDLRHNKISKVDCIAKLKTVKELMLDDNPICKKFSVPHAYVAQVKQKFTDLEWLDGHRLDSSNLATLQNFVLKYDLYTFADEFTKIFFPIYDSFERHRLMQMYDDESIFTLSIHYDINRPQFALQGNIYSRIQKYANLSRNVYKISNMDKSIENVHLGVGKIGRIFSELPKTAHDFSSFCIDVPFEKNGLIFLTVTGAFEEQGQSLNESNFPMGFSRTFILRETKGNEYYISNEQLFIFNPTQKIDIGIAWKQQVSEKLIEDQCRDLLPTEMEDKEAKLIIFRELTELKDEECLRQMEESFWNIKVAIAAFNALMDSQVLTDSKFDFK